MSNEKQAREAYRSIPPVDEILSSIQPESFRLPYGLIRQTIQKCLTEIRSEINSGDIPKNIPTYTTNTIIQKLQKTDVPEKVMSEYICDLLNEKD